MINIPLANSNYMEIEIEVDEEFVWVIRVSFTNKYFASNKLYTF